LDIVIVPRQRQEEILDYLSDEGSVQDLSVSRLRSRVEWGLQVPDDPSHTIYVWLDALTSYMTAVGLPWDSKADMKASGWPADIHVVGKDILRYGLCPHSYPDQVLTASSIAFMQSISPHFSWRWIYRYREEFCVTLIGQ
jgi:methionyl-tRNA synthetase